MKNKSYPSTIKVDGKVANLILRYLISPKYGDLETLVISIAIGTTIIPNFLVYLGVAINVMTVELCNQLDLKGIKSTTTILQMVDQSIAKIERVIEDVPIDVESWEYAVDFLILQPKKKHNGYTIILGRPWL